MAVLSSPSSPRVDTTPANESLADAREALAYWRGREARLAWHRRAARAEAREHAARWHARLVRAHFERSGLGRFVLLAPLVGALALPPREQSRRLRRLVWGTRLATRVRRIAVAAVVVWVGALALAVILAGQLL